MPWHDWGNRPITSTQFASSAPTSATLLAELNPTELGTENFRPSEQRSFHVTWITALVDAKDVRLEKATSTALSDVNRRYVFYMSSGVNQLDFMMSLGQNERLRIRLPSASSGVYGGALIAVPMT